jgi:hypothetical protein
MTASERDFPSVAWYRGVPIHAFQPRERIEKIVVPEIDRALALEGPAELARFALDSQNCPEARLTAEKRLLDLAGDANTNHRSIGKVDLAYVQACLAGLGVLDWADPARYDTLMNRDSSAPLRSPELAAELRAAKAARP